jgi:hypothetical protein
MSTERAQLQNHLYSEHAGVLAAASLPSGPVREKLAFWIELEASLE